MAVAALPKSKLGFSAHSEAPCCKHFSFTSPASSTFWKLSKNTNESKTSQQFRRVYASVRAFLFFVALHHPGSAAEQFPFLPPLLAASSAGHPHQEHCDSQVTHAVAMWVGTLPCPAPKDTAFYGVFRVEVVAVRSTSLLVLHQPQGAELPVLWNQNEELVHVTSEPAAVSMDFSTCRIFLRSCGTIGGCHLLHVAAAQLHQQAFAMQRAVTQPHRAPEQYKDASYSADALIAAAPFF